MPQYLQLSHPLESVCWGFKHRRYQNIVSVHSVWWLMSYLKKILSYKAKLPQKTKRRCPFFRQTEMIIVQFKKSFWWNIIDNYYSSTFTAMFQMPLPQEDENGDGRTKFGEPTCYESLLACCGNMFGCLKIWCPCVCCCCKSPIYQVLLR